MLKRLCRWILRREIAAAKLEHDLDLLDIEFLVENVSKVYCHVTGDRCSNVMTYADVVKGLADDETDRQCEIAVADAIEERNVESSEKIVRLADALIQCVREFDEPSIWGEHIGALDKAVSEHEGTRTNAIDSLPVEVQL